MKTKAIIIWFFILNDVHAQTWYPVGTGTNGAISSLYNDTANDLLYLGGYFSNAGGLGANRIATWDGTSWTSLGSGISGSLVSCITKYNNEIYAGGVFTSAGGIPANNIARWDGTNWSNLLLGTNGWVKTMAVYNNELYVGGTFTIANGSVVNHIAKWNGTNWASLGSGINGAAVNALQVYNGKLYVGGNFDSAGTVPTYYIAEWDGNNWSSVGNGLSNIVFSMSAFDNKLYISYFINTAIWDGTFLTAWNGGINNGNVLCMISDSVNVYFGGHFTNIGGNPINRIAKWNKSAWYSYDTGIGFGGVFAMAIYHNELYAGGWFDSVGTNALPYITRWNLTTSLNDNLSNDPNGFSIYPNPFAESTLISFQNNVEPQSELIIYNNLGVPVKIFDTKIFTSHPELKIPFFSDNLPTGIYYATLKSRDKLRTKKIVILK